MKKPYDRCAAWRKRNPWSRYCEFARRRCNDQDPEGPNFANYYAKGITCTLDSKQTKIMWERDGAAKMKKPSIDRIDSSKGYHFENCRFMEFVDNLRRAWDKSAAVPEPDAAAEFV